MKPHITNTAASSNNRQPSPDHSPMSNRIARSVLNALSAHIAILDENGVILQTNRAWQEFGSRNGMTVNTDSVGLNYLEICEAPDGEPNDIAGKAAAGIRSVIQGKTGEFLMDYPCHSPTEQHWFYMRVVPISDAVPLRVVVSHENITALKQTQDALQMREQELEAQKRSLEETNIALKVLLKQRETDAAELEKKILANIQKLVLPYVEKLRNAPLKERERVYAELIHARLQEIASPFLQRLSAQSLLMTPQEIQVATLIREGKVSKEIASALNVSVATVNFHRKNIREKLGLRHSHTNLRTFLLSMT